MSRLLSQPAFAAALGVSVRTFRRWRRLGVIPPPLALPGHPRWPADALEQVLAARQREAAWSQSSWPRRARARAAVA
ncbi:MAG TPA: hypothetical protein VNI83_02565 [Vicinamibacterales bacterium]|nr:hypothetical protein [Vicinamibacterales bacterium]